MTPMPTSPDVERPAGKRRKDDSAKQKIEQGSAEHRSFGSI